MMFKKLTPEEETTFRNWAWEHWKPHTTPEEIWHPVVREEWHLIDLFARDVRAQLEDIAPDLPQTPEGALDISPSDAAGLVLGSLEESTRYLIFRNKVPLGVDRLRWVADQIKDYF